MAISPNPLSRHGSTWPRLARVDFAPLRSLLMSALVGCLLLANGAWATYIVRDEVRRSQEIIFHWTFDGLEVATMPGADRFYDVTIRVEGEKSFGATVPLFDFGLGKFDFRALYPEFAGKSAEFTFYAPRFATDWRQKIISPGGSSEVTGGNIRRGSPWAFQPLDALPAISTRIPDLAPVGADADLTIYTAVNLDLYRRSNPLGFLGGLWSVGDSLSDLGLEIVDGQIVGLEGIYWSTTPFMFDADPAGRGFTPVGGDVNLLDSASFGHEITITQQHAETTVPAPGSAALLALGLAVLWGCRAITFEGSK